MEEVVTMDTEYLGVIDGPNERILSRRRGDAQYVRELLWRWENGISM